MPRQNDIEALIQLTFDAGMAIHKDVGPGLVESVYERVLADRLQQSGIKVDRQKPVHVEIYGKRYDDAFRYDLLLNDILLVEIKSIDKLGPIHNKQVLTYYPSYEPALWPAAQFRLRSLSTGHEAHCE